MEVEKPQQPLLSSEQPEQEETPEQTEQDPKLYWDTLHCENCSQNLCKDKSKHKTKYMVGAAAFGTIFGIASLVFTSGFGLLVVIPITGGICKKGWKTKKYGVCNNCGEKVRLNKKKTVIKRVEKEGDRTKSMRNLNTDCNNHDGHNEAPTVQVEW